MTNRVTEDFGRRNLDFHTPKVVEVLPEHFKGDYPKLIALLEAYYNYLDSDGNFNDDLRQLLRARDINGVSLQFLDYLLKETGGGITGDKFTDPRIIAQFFPDYFRLKGSLLSAQSFFRALYGEEVQISYPKDQVFIVGESLLGPESQRYIQDGRLYQTLSILVKSSHPISEWKELYKKYVHPAGFYLGSEVIIEGVVSLSTNPMPTAIPDSSASFVSVIGDATLTSDQPYEAMTGFYINPTTTDAYRIDLDKNVADIAGDSAGLVSDQYATILQIATPNSFNFSDSNDPIGLDFSNDIDTFDRSYFDSSGVAV